MRMMVMATRITMKDRILRHLQDYGKITSWEAIEDYGCTRISEYIRKLRSENYLIVSNWQKSKNRYGDCVRFVSYELRKENNNE